MSVVAHQPLELLVRELEVPRSSYETAVERYKDLGAWLHDSEKAGCAVYGPDVSPQGSFRIGTAIRPLGGEPYDLDLVVRLTLGISPSTASQEALKLLLGRDLEAYRKERQVRQALEEKNRCWRLEYQDSLAFHIDALPGVSHTPQERRLLAERMVVAKTALSQEAAALAQFALAITDRRLPNYGLVDPRWPVSNPEGFARWFEARMKLASRAIQRRVLREAVASIEELPSYRWKSPLQWVIQILKRHRDVMFREAPEGKPISVIITTLAAMLYAGEDDVEDALSNVLDRMHTAVAAGRPRVPNPVNPVEDFADKWETPEGKRLRLKENFEQWVIQARKDFEHVARAQGRTLIQQARDKFGVYLPESAAGETSRPAAPRIQVIASAPAPWRA
jgi:hypothetical protein